MPPERKLPAPWEVAIDSESPDFRLWRCLVPGGWLYTWGSALEFVPAPPAERPAVGPAGGKLIEFEMPPGAKGCALAIMVTIGESVEPSSDDPPGQVKTTLSVSLMPHRSANEDLVRSCLDLVAQTMQARGGN